MEPVHRYPDSPVFYRSLTRDFPLAVKGEGCWIEDENGKRYLDAVGGAYVATIGHGVREIGEAMADQAGRLAYVSGAAFTNEAVEKLCANLVGRTPGMDRAKRCRSWISRRRANAEVPTLSVEADLSQV